MAKIIVFKRSDGSVTRRIPARKEDVSKVYPEVLSMTDDQYLEYVKNHNIPSDATDIMVIEESEQPSFEHRDCWTINNGKIEVRQDKVAEKENRKSRRNAILLKLKLTEEEFKELVRGLNG